MAMLNSSMRKSVIFVISSMSMGGEQRSLSLLSAKLKEHFDIKIAYFVHEASFIQMDLDIELIPIDSTQHFVLKYLKRIQSLQGLFSKHPNSTIVGYGMVASIFSAFALLNRKNQLIIAERNDPSKTSLLIKMLRSLLYFRAQEAVFQTETASQYFPKYYFQKRHIVHNFVDDRLFNQVVFERKDIIINVSRFEKAKNHVLLIKAFAQVHKKFPQFELHLYGSGPLKRKIFKTIENFGLQSQVKVFDPIQNVYEKIAESTLFVLSSNHEGFPNSLMEAYVLGVPCISTDCPVGGPREILQDELQWLIRVNHEKLLAIKMMQYLQYIRLNQPIFRTIERFKHQRSVNQWCKIIDSCI